jgi:hypothetical protein
LSRIRLFAAIVGASALSMLAFAAVSGAQTLTTVTTPDPTTAGTTQLGVGTSNLASFLYAAIPYLLVVAVASAIVGFVIHRIRGAR